MCVRQLQTPAYAHLEIQFRYVAHSTDRAHLQHTWKFIMTMGKYHVAFLADDVQGFSRNSGVEVIPFLTLR